MAHEELSLSTPPPPQARESARLDDGIAESWVMARYLRFNHLLLDDIHRQRRIMVERDDLLKAAALGYSPSRPPTGGQKEPHPSSSPSPHWSF